MNETRKGWTKGAQETLTVMTADFKALRRKTKSRWGANGPKDVLSGEQTFTAIILIMPPDKSAHWKTIFFI